METHSTSPGWAGAHSHVMVRQPTANEPATVISTSTARPTPTGVARRSTCRSCGECDLASGPIPPTRLPRRPPGPPSPGRSLSPETAQHALQSGGVPAHHVDSRSSTTHCPCTSVPTHSELSSWQWRATSTDYDRRMTSPHVGLGDLISWQMASATAGGRSSLEQPAAAAGGMVKTGCAGVPRVEPFTTRDIREF
jgi:hypothetical protein